MIRKLVLFLAVLGSFWLFVGFHAFSAAVDAGLTRTWGGQCHTDTECEQ